MKMYSYTLTMFTHNTTYRQGGTLALQNLPPQTSGGLCFGIFFPFLFMKYRQMSKSMLTDTEEREELFSLRALITPQANCLQTFSCFILIIFGFS